MPLMLLKTLRRRQRASRGMTLFEIIVVITILSLLMAAVGVAVIPQLDKAKQDTARMDIGNLQTALKTYYAKKGNYPDTGSGLRVLVESQILDRAPVDPWGHDYVYMNEGGKPVVISYGRDGSPGGSELDEDISSKNSTKKP